MPNHYVFAGIDPGLDGGIGIIKTNVNNMLIEAVAHPMPTKPGAKTREVNARQLSMLLHEVNMTVGIEIVHAMPKQGVSSVFTFGKGYGKVLGALEVDKHPILEVTPQRWKKAILDGLGREKGDAIRFVMSMFPDVELKKSERSTTPHDGMAEALCIAEYARRSHFISLFQGVS